MANHKTTTSRSSKTPRKQVNGKPGKKAVTIVSSVKEQKRNGKVDSISVRMYCHGFGDCFLLTFKEKRKDVFRMLIDCGLLTGKTDPLKQVIENIKQDCENHLDIVVLTHQHKDHISGFNLRDEHKNLLWDDILVDNVWLAWTEDVGPDGDDLAIQLKDRQKKKQKALAQALAKYYNLINSKEHIDIMNNEYNGNEYLAAQNRYATALDQLLNFSGLGTESNNEALALGELALTMEDAMNYFKRRKKELERKGEQGPHITFWSPGEMAEKKQTGLNGIRFYFLGPPKDYNKLRIMEDNTHNEMYFSDLGLSDNFYLALDGQEEDESNSLSPFHSKYFFNEGDIKEEDLIKEENKDHIWNLYHHKEQSWRQIEADWLHNAGALALHLDSYTNNTSLVIAIEFEESGKVLLFPADAQIGNWLSWTDVESEKENEPKLQWTVNKNGTKKNITATQLLERTVFYKVGHHCSHNATARKHGLELMKSDELVAMIPVDEFVASKQGKRGWKMPAKDLYDRLLQKTQGRIIRLDEGNILKKGTGNLPERAKPTKAQLQAFNKRFIESKIMITTDDGTIRPLYFEYLIE